MAQQLNPFVYGKPVPSTHFIGREEIINQCYNRLAGPVRSSIAISGEQGIGKTSLLRYLAHTAEIDQWGQPHTHNTFVYVYCPTIGQFTPTRFWHHVLELIKQQEQDPALHEQIDDLLQQPQIEVYHCQRFLRWLSQQQFSLVLLLDGFTWIVKTDTADRTTISNFLSNLRAFTNLPDDYALTMLTTTREPLNVLCHDIVRNNPESHFYNNFIFVRLAPFTLEEINTLFQQALSQTNFKFDQIDYTFLHRLAGTHPALLQIAGYHLFEERRIGPPTHQTHQNVIEAFEREARHYFSSFWTKASPLEQTLLLLIILAHLPEQFTSQLDMTDGEMQRLLQKYERDLTGLAERGLIQKVENSYQVSSAIFAWWIVREIAAESETSLAASYKAISEEPLRQVWQVFKRTAPHLTGIETLSFWMNTPSIREQSDHGTQSPDVEKPFSTDEERVLLQGELAQHWRNLYKLRDKKIKFGLDVPLWIENQIEDEEYEIAQIEARLKSLEEEDA